MQNGLVASDGGLITSSGTWCRSVPFNTRDLEVNASINAERYLNMQRVPCSPGFIMSEIGVNVLPSKWPSTECPEE